MGRPGLPPGWVVKELADRGYSEGEVARIGALYVEAAAGRRLEGEAAMAELNMCTLDRIAERRVESTSA